MDLILIPLHLITSPAEIHMRSDQMCWPEERLTRRAKVARVWGSLETFLRCLSTFFQFAHLPRAGIVQYRFSSWSGIFFQMDCCNEKVGVRISQSVFLNAVHYLTHFSSSLHEEGEPWSHRKLVFIWFKNTDGEVRTPIFSLPGLRNT